MNAVIIQANEVLETNIALVYKSIFLGETASVLKNMDIDVKVHDVTIAGYDLQNVIKVFLEKPQIVVLVVDVQQARLAKRIAEYCKLCSPKSNVIVIGRATSFIPQFFKRYPFDAVHINGDREAALINYIKYLRGELQKKEIANLYLVEKEGGYCATHVKWLEPQSWCTPNLPCLPIETYQRLNAIQHPGRDLFIGVTATKGCIYGCKYCGASTEEGKKIRYGVAQKIVDWSNSVAFDCTIQLWSPDILSSKEWLGEFIHTYETQNSNFKWRGVARISSVDESKVSILHGHNCKEIAIGVEMIKKRTHIALKGSQIQLENTISLFDKYDIKLKCLLMLGYPGYNIDDAIYTIKLLKKYGLDYRITGYTPLQNLSGMSVADLDRIMIENYDRRTFYQKQGINSEMFYEILSSNGEVLL